MAGKITTILAKREAETYCTQGLHKEALRIYRSLLASSPNIDPALKTGIENQIGKISVEVESGALKEANLMTADDIMRVKKGWGEEATESDMMICAQAFCQIACYKEALLELVGMLQKGCATEKTAPLMADCLAKMYPPEKLSDIIEKIIKKSFNQPGEQLNFSALLAEEMVALKQPHHANAILAYLQKYPECDGESSQRLAAIADSIERLGQRQVHAAPNPQGIAPEQPSPAANDIGTPLSQQREKPIDKIRSFLRWLPYFGKQP